MTPMLVVLPFRLRSEPNERAHWSVRGKRTAEQRLVTHMKVRAALCGKRPLCPVRITFTRLGKRAFDTDNLAAACKACRDGVADAFGVDDGSDYFDWQYTQRVGAKQGYGVEIRIEARS